MAGGCFHSVMSRIAGVDGCHLGPPIGRSRGWLRCRPSSSLRRRSLSEASHRRAASSISCRRSVPVPPPQKLRFEVEPLRTHYHRRHLSRYDGGSENWLVGFFSSFGGERAVVSILDLDLAPQPTVFAELHAAGPRDWVVLPRTFPAK